MNKSWSWLGVLSLAPLLGASQTLVQAASLLLATLVVVLLYSLAMLALRRFLHPTLRETASIVLAAAIVSCLDLALRAWALEIHQGLGLYLALIGLNCLLLERSLFSEASHSRPALRLMAAYGALVLTLGLSRELLANGTLSLDMSLIREASGLRLATLAPGGFILLGLLVAAWRSLSGHTTRIRKETLAP